MPQITQLEFIFASQLFWLTLAFGFIYFVVARGMVPKVREGIEDRDRKIEDDLEAAKIARAAADESEAEWRTRMDAARAEAGRIAQKARMDSALVIEAKVAKALAEIDAMTERATVSIQTAVEAARGEMETAAVDAAQQMVEKLTGLQIARKDAINAVAAEFELLAGPMPGEKRQGTRTKRVASQRR